MNLTPGELYFIGEYDFKAAQRTDFYKIGIVRNDGKDNRSSQDRLKEHQTGNPRKLEIVYTFKADAVEAIETNLHYRLARHRVPGEWMKLNARELEAAIAEAESIKDQMSLHIQVFRDTDELKAQVSNGEEIPPITESEFWFTKHQDAKVMFESCEEVMKEYKDLLTVSHEKGEDISLFAKQKEKVGRTVFDAESLKEKHPEIYSSFVSEETYISQRFVVTSIKQWKKSLEEIDADLASSLAEFRSELKGSQEGDLSSLLHNLYLKVLSIGKYAEWEMELAKAQLKKLCGLYDSISGICAWRRTKSTKEVFDRNSFAEKHPDLSEMLTSISSNIESLSIEPRASYQ